MIRSNTVFVQLFRYGLVGVTVLIADFLAFTAMLAVSSPGKYLIANGCGKLTGALLGFVLHRKFTFSWRQRDRASRQFSAYVVLFAANLAASTGLLWLLVDLGRANPFIAKLAVDAVVIGSAFVVSRIWVYRAA